VIVDTHGQGSFFDDQIDVPPVDTPFLAGGTPTSAPRRGNGSSPRQPDPKVGPRPAARRARRGDPATAHDAALAEHRLSEHRWRALMRLNFAAGAGLTDFELAERTGLAQTSVGKRRLELVEMGYVEMATGSRPAPSGRAAQVWRITPTGRDRYRAEVERRREPVGVTS